MQEIKKGWKKVKLLDVISTKKGYAFKSSWFGKGNHPVIKVSDFTMSSISNEKINYVSDELFFENEKHKVLEKDILIQTVGSWPSAPLSVVGKVVRVPSYLNNALLNQNIVKISPNINLLDNDFLFYMLKSSYFKGYIEGGAQGAASQASITLKHIINFSFFLPPLSTQQKIASILSKYDDLIENNNKRIKVLEETAQSIYEEWFVKYNFPGSENVDMIDSGNDDFGMIPEGWEVKKVEDYVDFVRGVEPGSKNYKENINKNEDDIVFIRVGDLGNRNSGIYINIDLSKGKIVNEEDVLVTFDGTVGIVKRGFSGCYSTGIRKLSGKNDFISNYFLYLLFKSENIQNKIKEHAKGTTILHAGESIKYMEFILAKEDVYNRFNYIVGKILDEILNIEKQNQILKQTRDLLIPRLVNGELDVENLNVK